MDWQGIIVKDPRIMAGRPTIKGTRISVELVLELRHNGWTEAEMLQNYPRLTSEGIQACFSYADAHSMVAFADWDTELCPYHSHQDHSRKNLLPQAE
jgi:uncharacterized protein (DUF433 family)